MHDLTPFPLPLLNKWGKFREEGQSPSRSLRQHISGVSIKRLLILLVAFEIADGVITHFLIVTGIARESNPLLAPLVGDVGFLVLKVAGALFCALILWDIYRHWRRVALWATWAFVIFYGGVALWNLQLLAIGLSPL